MDLTPPGDNLTFPDIRSAPGAILVVTGGRGTGKTPYCHKAVEYYRRAGLKVSGLISFGRFENGQKNGFFAQDLVSQETRLAVSSVPGEIDGFQYGSWTFDPEIFEWGNQLLLQTTGSDVLVIDELGDLEFNLQTGWTAGFEALRRRNYLLAIVVIRPKCIGSFTKMGFSYLIKEILHPQ